MNQQSLLDAVAAIPAHLDRRPKPESHVQRAHAKRAPSAAHRWMVCPGSIRMSEGIESVASTYAAEGTAAHELAAHCLKNDLEPEKFLGGVIDISKNNPGEMFGNKGLTDGETRFEVDEEMVEGVRLYIDTVNSLKPKEGDYEFDVEQRLDMTHLHPDIFGTGDTVLYQTSAGRLHVIDFKYGKGVAVEPEGNPQLMLYGAGAARRYHNRPLTDIVLHIVQPRAPHLCGPVRSWKTDPLELLEFEDEIKNAARSTEVAAAAYDDALCDSEADWAKRFLAAGGHCRFCPASAICPARREQMLSIAQGEFGEEMPEPSKMPHEHLGRVLTEADLIFDWAKSVQEFAHAEAMAGRIPEGFKLVAKRAVRKWRDEQMVVDKLTVDLGFDDDQIKSEPKLLGPAPIEKLLGKKPFAKEFGDLVKKESSGTNLVPLADPREAVSVDAASEFAE